MKKIIFYIILLLFYSSLSNAHGIIVIKGVGHNEGYIDLKIYNNKESFLKEELAIESIRKKSNKGEVIIPLSKIHEGKIAVVVYHDENNDGKLNTGLFWKPKEGYAFSNNYTPKGPPLFSKASFFLVHNKPVYIKLKY